MPAEQIFLPILGLILVVVGLWALVRYKPGRKSKPQPNLAARFSGVRLDKPSQPQNSEALMADDDPMSLLDHATANIDTSVAAASDLAGKSETELLSDASEVLVLNVLPSKVVSFEGSEVLKVLKSYELKFGEMNLFHALDEQGGYLYSVMRYHSDGEQGGFDLQSLTDEQIDGLTFLMPLPHPKPAIASEWMLSHSGSMARDLDASVYREDMQALDRAGRDDISERASRYL